MRYSFLFSDQQDEPRFSTAEPLDQCPFDESKIKVVPDPIVFHEIIAVQTKSKEYKSCEGLFISELMRKCLGSEGW